MISNVCSKKAPITLFSYFTIVRRIVTLFFSIFLFFICLYRQSYELRDFNFWSPFLPTSPLSSLPPPFLSFITIVRRSISLFHSIFLLFIISFYHHFSSYHHLHDFHFLFFVPSNFSTLSFPPSVFLLSRSLED